MNVGIIICSRVDSTRIPNKCFKQIHGRTLIDRLIYQLKKTNLRIYVAAPECQQDVYIKNLAGKCNLFFGDKDSPLKRMYQCAEHNKIDVVIRVSHDKIFLDENLIHMALTQFIATKVDYLYSTEFTAGSGFEIISYAALKSCAEKYSATNIEHIGYAIKSVTDEIAHFAVPPRYRSKARLLIDHPKDLDLMWMIFQELKDNAKLTTVIDHLNAVPRLKYYNMLPEITVYTCVYNMKKYLSECAASVLAQTIFGKCEYIIIDDASTDLGEQTVMDILPKDVFRYVDRVKVVVNEKNIGLAASSNVALNHAKGKYIIRLDADDYFTSERSLSDTLNAFNEHIDAVYVDNHFQRAMDHHHIGGAMFKTNAVHNIKFNDKLRGYEGLDFFLCAKDLLEIKYLNKATYHYRQHNQSMSKTNLQERSKIRKSLLST